MDTNPAGIVPSTLSTEELIRYARMSLADPACGLKIPQDIAQELLLRLESYARHYA